jgi:hypothetical protein
MVYLLSIATELCLLTPDNHSGKIGTPGSSASGGTDSGSINRTIVNPGVLAGKTSTLPPANSMIERAAWMRANVAGNVTCA